MAIVPVRKLSGALVEMEPFAGLDLFTHAAGLAAFKDANGATYLAKNENARIIRRVLERRLGAVKVWTPPTNPAGAKALGADSKYVKIPAASQLVLPLGGFSLRNTFTAVRPSAGNTGYILASRQNGQTYGVIWQTLNDSGIFTANVRWSSGVTTTLTSTALTAAAIQHGLLVYDDVAGTLTQYLNGGSGNGGQTLVATPGSGLQPNQTASIDWYIGVEWNPAAPGVTANSNFPGTLDGFTLKRFAGSGTSSVATLLAHSGHQEPSPRQPGVVFNYDFDNASTTVLYDTSRYQNNATITGGCTNAGPIAMSGQAAQLIAVVETPSGTYYNVVVFAGSLFFEKIR